jgi:hypothetical protein
MTPKWLFQVMWFGAGVGGSGALWYFLSQQNYLAVTLTAVATGMVVLIAVALHIRNDRLRSEQKIATANPNPLPEQLTSANLSAEATPSVTQRPIETKVYLQEKSPNEVFTRINSLRPLERDMVTKQTYIGRWVRWSDTLLSIEPIGPLGGEGYTVTVNGGSFGYARLEFLPIERHLVEPLQEGDLISYEAKITQVNTNDIYLADVTFTQPEERSFVNITLEELLRVFDEHTKIQARTLISDFIGKWMIVSGPLGDVGEFTSFSQVTFAHRPSLPLDTHYFDTVYMYFRNKKWVDRLSIMNKGDNITVIGRIREVGPGELHLDNCELIDSRH